MHGSVQKENTTFPTAFCLTTVKPATIFTEPSTSDWLYFEILKILKEYKITLNECQFNLLVTPYVQTVSLNFCFLLTQQSNCAFYL